jgi:hypothetical protein
VWDEFNLRRFKLALSDRFHFVLTVVDHQAIELMKLMILLVTMLVIANSSGAA